jgi:hypothetical protein
MPKITSRILTTQSASAGHASIVDTATSSPHLGSLYIYAGQHQESLMNEGKLTASAVKLSSPVRIATQKGFDWKKNRNPYQRIIHLRDLATNWDHYGASPFSKTQIRKSLDVYSAVISFLLARHLNLSQGEPFIAPGSNGKVLFEWAGSRFPVRQLEIEVSSDASDLEFLKVSQNFEEEGTINEAQIESLLSWLFEVQ